MHNEEDKKPRNAEGIRHFISKTLNERKKNLAEEVVSLADKYIRDNVHKIIATTFGFEVHWATRDFEFHKGFEKGAMAAKLAEYANNEAVHLFLKSAIEGFEKTIPKRTLTLWKKNYREYYEEAFWDRARELLEKRAVEKGREDATKTYSEFLQTVFNEDPEINETEGNDGDEGNTTAGSGGGADAPEEDEDDDEEGDDADAEDES